jgi:hypothetical protein
MRIKKLIWQVVIFTLSLGISFIAAWADQLPEGFVYVNEAAPLI